MTTTENGAEPLLPLKGVPKNFGPVPALGCIAFPKGTGAVV